METIHVVIAEMSALTRLGITSVLKNMDSPMSIREISQPGRWLHALHKGSTTLVVLSSSFMNACSREHFDVLFLKDTTIARVLIHDTVLRHTDIHNFDEIITPDDSEKDICRKLEKQVAALSKSHFSVARAEEISEREKEVLRLVALGMTNKEIAEKLYISSHTVITHRKNITSKLGIKTIAGLTVYAVIHKLIAPEAVR